MSGPNLSIQRIERQLSGGSTEELDFATGVNLLVGVPNTGKTKWLETLDFLLGDPDQNPFEGADEAGLDSKYDAAAAEIFIGDDHFRIERKWRQSRAKTKIFVDDTDMTPREFQHWLMERLAIPQVHFPKGNPMSGQTWPELSFRMLLRHIHRRQKLWGDIADKQPDGEQHACLLQFLGLAELLFSDDYARLVKLKMDCDRLKARRDQYDQTLEELARDVLFEPGMTVGINTATLSAAEARLGKHVADLHERRTGLLQGAQEQAIEATEQSHVMKLGARRASLLVQLEELERKLEATKERRDDLKRSQTDIVNETERMARAADAGALLADLKITHCPACDQPVAQGNVHGDDCFLCHQQVPQAFTDESLGAVRIKFEHERLTAERTETEELIGVLDRDAAQLSKNIVTIRQELRKIKNELAPVRQAVSALVQEEVSAVDMALGEANEREAHLRRLAGALSVGDQMTEDVADLEKEIEPIQERVDEAKRAIDFDARAALLEDGMNSYLNAINELRPGVWRHNPVAIDLSPSSFTIRVGRRRWSAVLGGTDTLYFLMAYHYGLLSLSDKPGCHYPGLTIIDVPGEFAGEEVEDKENFIVQPFIDLVSREEFAGAQLIISGAAFSGLQGVHRKHLQHVYVA